MTYRPGIPDPSRVFRQGGSVLLSIHPESDGSRYLLDVRRSGYMADRCQIDMTAQDLRELDESFRETMERIANRYVTGLAPCDTQEQEEYIRPLAALGKRAYNRVFNDRQALQLIEDATAGNPPATIEVATRDFTLPWELLYPNDLLDEPLRWENFWGMNHIISRTIIMRDGQRCFFPPEIYTDPVPKVGLLTYGKLKYVSSQEIPFFEKLHDSGDIALMHLKDLDASQWTNEYMQFRDFWHNSFDLAHFACHAVFKNGSRAESYLKLSSEFRISFENMDVYGLTVAGGPLIILNACATGNVDPLYTSNFAEKFTRLDTRGVVATECRIPDAFGAAFTEHLYRHHLLPGEPLGQGLLETRKFFLARQNPTALTYAMYAPPETRLERSERNEET